MIRDMQLCQEDGPVTGKRFPLATSTHEALGFYFLGEIAFLVTVSRIAITEDVTVLGSGMGACTCGGKNEDHEN